jgi:hypothetical protein
MSFRDWFVRKQWALFGWKQDAPQTPQQVISGVRENYKQLLREHVQLEGDYIDLEDENDTLRRIIARVHDELHDPMGQYWCDRPEEDRKLLEGIRDYVDECMGWDDE